MVEEVEEMMWFALWGCIVTAHKKTGVIDIIDHDVCKIQLDDERFILINSSQCEGKVEGDTIEVKHDTDR